MAGHSPLSTSSHQRRIECPERTTVGSESKGCNLATFFVYLIRCSDDSYYVGSTSNLPQRVKTHNAGKGSEYTRYRRPVELMYSEPADSELNAVRRERQIKKWSRAKKEALIACDMKRLKSLSRRRRR